MAQDTAQPSIERTGGPGTEAPPVAPPSPEAPKTEREGPRLHIARGRLRPGRPRLYIGAALAVLVIGFFLWRYFTSYESTDDAQVDVHLYPVSARISGYVIKVNVGDNQWVDKGTVLVEIDPKDYQVAVAQARANLDSAIATARSQNIT